MFRTKDNSSLRRNKNILLCVHGVDVCFYVCFCTDMDSDMFSSSSNLDVIQKSQLIQAAATASQSYKSEQLKTDPLLATTTACVTSTTSARPTTILLTTTTSSTTSHAFSHCSQPVFPSTLQIKQEPVDSFDMLQDHTGTWLPTSWIDEKTALELLLAPTC